MKPELTLKLTLNKETIRRLTESELQAVAGGATNPAALSLTRITCQSSCCDTLTTITVSGRAIYTEA